MNANACTDSSVQAATEIVASNSDNLPEIFFQRLHFNKNPSNTHNFNEQLFQYTNVTSQLMIHFNINSLKAHFDELNEFLLYFSSPPSIIFISETRINVKPLININLPDYTFIHVPSTSKAGGVGACFFNNLKVSVKDNFELYVQGCEDLWFDVKFSKQNNNHLFAVIYRHPHKNLPQFLNALNKKLALFKT